MLEPGSDTDRLAIKPAVLPNALRVVALAGCTIALATGAAHGGQVSTRIACAAAAALLLVVAGFLAIRMIRRRPVLVVEPNGFTVPRQVEGFIRWDGIAYLEQILSGRGSSLILTLYPGAAASLEPMWLRRRALVFGLASPTRLRVGLGNLDLSPERTTALFKERVLAERGPAAFDRPTTRGIARRPVAAPTRPIFAYGLIALLCTVFAAEVALSPTRRGPLEIDVQTLIMLGGNQRGLSVDRHELWRFVTSALLHANALHLAFNVWALVIAASLLEAMVGWRWFAATFALSALGGALFSMLINPPNLVSVGASGGIVGLAAATAFVSRHFESGPTRTRLLVGSLGILVPSLLPVLGSIKTVVGRVDLADHLGGAMLGSFSGLLMLSLWRQDLPRPRLAGLGLAMAGLFFLVATASLFPIARNQSLAAELAPDLPLNPQSGKPLSASLVSRYPRDPRVRYFHALAALDRHDTATARSDLERAMADHDTLAMTEGLDPYLRGLLAEVMVSQGHPVDAQRLAAGHCPEIVTVFGATIDRFGLCRHHASEPAAPEP